MKNNLIGISGKINSGKDTAVKVIQLLSNPTYELTTTENLIKDLNNIDQYIQSIENSVYYYETFYNKKFADKLKDMICLMIGCTREQLEDREFKNKELGEEWWYYKVHKDVSNSYGSILLPYIGNEDKTHLTLYKLTPRKIMQLLGTEAGRQIIHPDIWVNASFSNYAKKLLANRYFHRSEVYDFDNDLEFEEKYPNWIFSDTRFPNEANKIKREGGLLIRVNREFRYRYPSVWKEYLTSKNKYDFGVNILDYVEDVYPDLYEVITHDSETSLDSYDGFNITVDNNGTLKEFIETIVEIYKNCIKGE